MISIAVALAITSPALIEERISTPVSGLAAPKEAKRAVVACGIPSRRVSVHYEQMLQEDIVRIGRGGDVFSEGILECIAQASLATSYYVFFKDRAAQAHYHPIYLRLSDIAGVKQAKEWLRERNLLSTLPLPQRNQPLSDYTKAVEMFCGVTEGTLLTTLDDHSITFTEDGLGRLTEGGIEGAAASEAQFECIMNAIEAADLKSQDLFFGFLGNAAAEHALSQKPTEH